MTDVGDSKKSDLSALAEVIRNTLKLTPGEYLSKSTVDVDHLLSTIATLLTYYELNEQGLRKLPFLLFGLKLTVDMYQSQAFAKLPMQANSKDPIKLPELLEAIRSYFSGQLTLSSALISLSRPIVFSPDRFDSGIQECKRKVKLLVDAAKLPSSHLELYSSYLPPELRAPALSFLAQNPNASDSVFRDFIHRQHSLARKSTVSSSAYSSFSSSALSSTSSAPFRLPFAPPRPGDPDYVSSEYCSYHKDNGHTIEKCRELYTLANPEKQSRYSSLNSANSGPVPKAQSTSKPADSISKSYYLPTKGLKPPFPKPPKLHNGHLVLPISLHADHFRVQSYALPDHGTPNESYIREDIARSLGFKRDFNRKSGIPHSLHDLIFSIGRFRIQVTANQITQNVVFNIVPHDSTYQKLQVPVILSARDFGLFKIVPVPQAGLFYSFDGENFSKPQQLVDYSTIDPAAYNLAPPMSFHETDALPILGNGSTGLDSSSDGDSDGDSDSSDKTVEYGIF
jgi:hypothetical protein